MPNNLIQSFVDDLVVQAGFVHLTPEKEKEYKNNLAALVSKKLGIEMMKELKEDDMKEYLNLMEKESTSEQMYEFFNSKIADLDEKVVEILKKFRAQFLENLVTAANFSKLKFDQSAK